MQKVKLVMCGIAFIYTDKNFDQCRQAIEKMTDSIAHRGPDERNTLQLEHKERRLYFGHTRLSILDLSDSASQPMFDESSGSYLIYNGELYNYIDIKNKLETRGYHIRSSGDTEVFLKALLEWGSDILPEMRGMFSFVFWNGLKKELLAARDPFGIKPLYYSASNGYFIAGSEVNTILKSSLLNFKINQDSINTFLTYGAVIRPDTIVSQIRELKPGSYFLIKELGKEIEEKKYWTLSQHPGRSKIQNTIEAEELIENQLQLSVEKHLISDVPVGIFLSGGIDSSLVSIFAASKRPDLNLFTIAFSELEYSELKFAFEVSEKIEGKQKIISMNPDDVARHILSFISSMDQPTVDGINTYIISRIARHNDIKVLISGLGGDEVFGGYTSFRNVPLLQKMKYILYPLSLSLKNISTSNYSLYDKISYSLKTKHAYEDYLLQRSIRWGKNSLPLDGETIPPFEYKILKKFLVDFKDPKLDNGFHSISIMELYFYMSNQLLRDSDVFSMANSIELRVPFLDLDLVTASHSISGSIHTDLFESKKLLKKILHKKIPYLDVDRRKMGFTFPWKVWLKGSLKDSLMQIIEDKEGYESLGLDWSKGKKLVHSFLAGDYSVSWYQIWSLYILLNWQRKNRISI